MNGTNDEAAKALVDTVDTALTAVYRGSLVLPTHWVLLVNETGIARSGNIGSSVGRFYSQGAMAYPTLLGILDMAQTQVRELVARQTT